MKKLFAPLLNDHVILWLVIINSILIFAQGFGLPEPYQFIVMLCDDLITVLFVIELITKLMVYSPHEYLKSHWNLFDGTVIILAVPSLFSLFLNQADESHVQYFLVLRVLRVFKFFRFIKYFPNIDKLLKAVQHALKASVIVLFGFVVYNFVISILSCFFYREIAPEYFGDPLLSFYSIFKIFTVEGWYEIPDLIASRSSLTVAFLTKC